MRVFTAVRHSADPSKFYGGLWSGNFYPALRELGHEIIESQTDLLPTSQFMGVDGRFTAEELAVRGETTDRILADHEPLAIRQPISVRFKSKGKTSSVSARSSEADISARS